MEAMVKSSYWMPAEVDSLLEGMAHHQRRTKVQVIEAAILYLSTVPKGKLSDTIIEVFGLIERNRNEATESRGSTEARPPVGQGIEEREVHESQPGLHEPPRTQVLGDA